MDARSIQRLLKVSGFYTGGIDGDFGPKSKAAVARALKENLPEALKWTEARQRVAAAQIVLNRLNYNPGRVDGYWGHNTQEAFNDWDHFVTTGSREILPGRGEDEPDNGPASPRARWPSQKGMAAFFGKAGEPLCTAGKVILPIPFRVAWNLNQKVKSFNCHEKVADAFTTIFGEAVKHYGEKEFAKLGLDLYGGCFNYRPMRGGASLSTHAYGIAYDADPERNQLRWGKDRAELAKAVYDPFWAIVEAQGAISLGRARNYDWMHFQFATL